jgi:drug/metabolite transporter (DMT)-like permease
MLFDIRTIVGALLGTYGVVLVVTGLVNDTAAEQAKTGGININLWAGIGMGAVGLFFLAWVLLRPVVPTATAPTVAGGHPEPPADEDNEPAR